MVDRKRKLSAKERIKQNMKKYQEKQERSGGFDWLDLPKDTEIYKVAPEKGKDFATITMDVVPYEITMEKHPDEFEPGDLWFMKNVLVHYKVGPDDKVLVCPSCIGKKCPICEYSKAEQDKADDKEERKKIWNEFKPRRQQMFNINIKGKPYLLIQSQGNFYDPLNKELKAAEENGDDSILYFFDPEEGKSLKVRFDQKTFNKNIYYEASRIDFIDRKPLSKEVLSKAIDLDAIVKVESYETIQSVFLGMDDDETEAAEEKKEDDEKEQNEEVDEDNPDFFSMSKIEMMRFVRENKEALGEDMKTYAKLPEKKLQEKLDNEWYTRETKNETDDTTECPHGHEFGVDTFMSDECTDCSEVERCTKRQEELEDIPF
jgi:hypothetical protein